MTTRRAKKKTFVGLSGGVDSAVSAAVLLEQGHDVTGVFIKVWQPEFLPCTWKEDRIEAMRVAAHLGIPFMTLDLEKEYKAGVVDHMIREYAAGRVPNPDVMCNAHVKFGAFLDFALGHDAEQIATGHYSRIKEIVPGGRDDPEKAVRYKLLRGVDPEKDQSYFLWTLTQRQLAHSLFPVGDLTKARVRSLAAKFDLPNAQRKDSQGLCFMGPVDMADFLRRYTNAVPGKVLDVSGREIGEHRGALIYAVGQRHGFHTEKLSSNEEPYFVIEKDMAKNTITVGHAPPRTPQKKAVELTISGVNDISGDLHAPENVLARMHHRGELVPVEISRITADASRVRILGKSEPTSPGQSLVFYRGEACLGGGIISG